VLTNVYGVFNYKLNKVKVEIDITEQEIKDLKVIRTYFGANDKTMLQHMAYKLLDDLVKKITRVEQSEKSVCSICNYTEGNAPKGNNFCNMCDNHF
jgi:hypothetical protein